MAKVRTVDFLPEIYQTPVNRQFLSATLDQLVQEPKFNRTQGYVGRRTGPGVRPTDGYVTEPTQTRTDYQLEPGVVTLKPDTDTVTDVITYPGISDAIAVQGGVTDDSNRLYTSDYYTWDPFVDYDKLVNFSQYYWVPAGPLAVDVYSTTTPLIEEFNVTRTSNGYSFTGANGVNPVLTLIRGGTYQFNVAQNKKEVVNVRVGNQGNNAFLLNYEPNPTLTLIRGNTYVFTMDLVELVTSFYIKTMASLGNTNLYSTGVTRNGAVQGLITFTVPQDAPDTLYYCSGTEVNMRGAFNVVDAVPGTGDLFWIQAQPGVKGSMPNASNISSRTVAGVTNNGVDLGTVRFTVPMAEAQEGYYNLEDIGTVDLISSEATFSDINNRSVVSFLEQYPHGIDGITNLEDRTIIFTVPDPSVSNLNNVWIATIVRVGQVDYIKLVIAQVIENEQKFSISFGDVYSQTQWYKHRGHFVRIPLLTAIQDTLYYQDGTNPGYFGEITLINQNLDNTLDINDILGKVNYVSPNGVTFTNGLKVQFIGAVSPSSYQNNSYYVEGVGTAIQLLPVNDFITPEPYTQSLDIPYSSEPYDYGGYDGTLNAPIIPEYFTINRSSPDNNAWSRSNRWFHIDVIQQASLANNIVPNVNNLNRARRPILEFRGGTRLFNSGTQALQPIQVIDFNITNALHDVNGATSYTVDGYELLPGNRVIFAGDINPDVRNRIYEVTLIVPDSVPPLIPEPVIYLVPTVDNIPLVDQTVVCLYGDVSEGVTYYFNGITWVESQQKVKTNQPPLFDVYDPQGISYGDEVKYPSATFKGSKLFSYAIGSGPVDAILGFSLSYLSINNIGDIVFDNTFYTQEFVYVTESNGISEPISNGFVRQYSNRVDYVREIGWQRAVTKSAIYQQIQFTYDGNDIKLDVKADINNVIPALKIYIAGVFQAPGTYRVGTTDNSTYIEWTKLYVPGDIIEVLVLSDQVSQMGFYQVPVNLENNPLNENPSALTLGTIRNHYTTIVENKIGFEGEINGANNSRDLGNIVPYGLQILQQSSPMTLAGYFMRSHEYDIFSSIAYSSREYIKFKTQLLETVIRNEFTTDNISDILDWCISDITTGRTSNNPFYWSDMLPTGSIYTETVTTINPITTNRFDTTQVYDFSNANYLGLLVFWTRGNTTVLLERNVEYVVSTDSPILTVIIPLEIGDIITVREYDSTVGNFVPNTPTKLGLYPQYRPRIFLDTSYVQEQIVIQGHDGSITVAFGDIRDQILLEFEKRIYNNLKNDGNPVPLTIDDVEPGFFRKTDYTNAEINNILAEDFLSWVGWNKLDYKAQYYIPNNEFTYNYSSAGTKLDAQYKVNNVDELLMPGAWRGIYRYFYDTIDPHLTPWEMLGFSEEPYWWYDRYGPAPYTNGNLVLWDDLEAGYVADPIAPYVNPRYVRPGLTSVIPVDSEGNLLSPLDSVVGQYDPTTWQKSWAVGDGGPVEAAWWTSSSYPFAVMRLLALTRPAEFFSLFADRNLYRYDYELGQYLYNGRYRLDARNLQVYGNGISKASYLDWIVDYNQQLGRNSSTALQTALDNIGVRLCYRLGAFSDKQYLQIYAERSSPNSINSSQLLPPESYDIQLYKNQPFGQLVYSALVVEVVDNGYAVYGYDNFNPYFTAFVSQSSGILRTISSGGTSVRVPANYTDIQVKIPYGYVFASTTMVVDFILSYGQLLVSQGMTFTAVENGYTLDWDQMAEEFLYFSQQGWNTGTIINLNPAANQFTATKPGAIVDTIESLTPENMVLNQNRTKLSTRDLVIEREGNTLRILSLTGQTISFLRLRFTNFEDIIILANKSIFNDLIYDPVTAARQSRVLVTGYVSADWNGELNAPGFILNRNNIEEWQPYRKYTKGQIVLYKNIYWSAISIVNPSQHFNYNEWVKNDYTKIQQGLLPNIANKADQLANSYNTYSANLNVDSDLMAYELIGFNPRQYMAALNLSDVTQVNLYQQFLGTKGTRLSAELFTYADLGKESGEYQIYENWAILASTYGANADRSFIELQLNEAKLTSNPSTIQIINPGTTSKADQSVYLNKVWRTSINLTSPEVFPTSFKSYDDVALPSAGYVDINDVDITVFDLTDPTSISSKIDTIGIGTIIWAAKTNSYEWDVFRCELVPARVIQLTDNLNSTSLVTFSGQHNLTVGELIIIRYISSSIDGVYRVLLTPSITTAIISFAFVNTNQTSITTNGLAFFLQSSRVAQASDVATLSYANSLLPGAKAWVDNNGAGQWAVVEKQQPFSFFQHFSPSPNTNDFYGAAISQSQDSLLALVGSPAASGGKGAVYSYVVDATQSATRTEYVLDQVIEFPVMNVGGFGCSISYGDTNWSAIGANTSNNGSGYVAISYQQPGSSGFMLTQLLLPPDINYFSPQPIGFGSSVIISADERWLYVGAPNGNKVYAYTIVPVPLELIQIVTDGVSTEYNYSNSILINGNQPGQLEVMLGDRVMVVDRDYTLNNGNVVFNTVPANDLLLTINRRFETQLDNNVYFDVPGTGLYGTDASFTIDILRGTYNVTLYNGGTGYQVGEGLIIKGKSIGGTSANNIVITVTSIGTDGEILTFNSTGLPPAPGTDFPLHPYLYSATNIYSFTVTVNGEIQRPEYDYTFDNRNRILTFINMPPVGAVIMVTAGSYWHYVSTITYPNTYSNAEFGYSVTTTSDGRQVVIGAPYDTNNNLPSGTVRIYDRSVIRIVITDTTQLTYFVDGPITGPISVSLNGTFLSNAALVSNGQYLYASSYVTLLNIELTIGDNLEIETNQFQILQTLTQAIQYDESRFGNTVDYSRYNEELYIGAPYDGTILVQAGSVARYTNQSRIYGITTSTIANPVLTGGDLLRINDVDVIIPMDNPTITGLIRAINDTIIPNVVANPTTDLILTGDGKTQVFQVGTIYSAASSYNTVVYVNDILVTNYYYDNNNTTITFTTPPALYSIIKVVSGRMTVSSINIGSDSNYLRNIAGDTELLVLPGTVGTAFYDVGFNTFVWSQTITSPNPVEYAHFGQSLSIDTSSVNLVVGAPNGNAYEPVTFDRNTTIFDDKSTIFADIIVNSGVAYTYDFLPSSTRSALNPGLFVFGQQIYNTAEETGDLFGYAVNYTSGSLMVGSPLTNNGNIDTGDVYVYKNTNNVPSWKVIHEQQPSVDANLIVSAFMYDRLLSSYQAYFDCINPLQGKVLSIAAKNIDYVGAVDPANYNIGSVHNIGDSWTSDHVGEIWWDTDTVRFIDPNQDDIAYASRRWGSVFPNSRVDIYQWTESEVPPSAYTGTGIPLSTTSYTVNTVLTQQGLLTTLYYFWVRNVTEIAVSAGKTLNTVAIAQYIENPRSSGVPYIAILNSSTVAIYNAMEYISAQDTILHIEYNQKYNDACIHTEYEMITDGDSSSFLNATLYRKFQDSLCGVNADGAPVPDPRLPPAERYGVQFRPRQSMFANRFLALENYLKSANRILLLYPMIETRSLTLLKTSDPKPPAISGDTINWNMQVANLTELSYQDISAQPNGYKYLVDTDSTQHGFWTIYIVRNGKLALYMVQTYNTPSYWYYTDWYQVGYNKTIQPITQVPNYSSLESLSLSVAPIGSSVRVTANSQGMWEIYLRNDTGWTRVGLQDGTIQFSETLWNYTIGQFGYDMRVYDAGYYDDQPTQETRFVIQAINEEIFIDDLAIYRNELLVLMFDYIYTEFAAPEWLFKTSLINVDHHIRALLPFESYQPDNQTFVLDYINEVKPYHDVIRQFNLIYDGGDVFAGRVTDFDCPSRWDPTLEVPQYVSPVLLPFVHAPTTIQSDVSDTPADAEVWTVAPWSDWYNNYLLGVQGVSVYQPGSGYTSPPTITVEGDCYTPAVLNAIINGAGQLAGIDIVSSGSGYRNTATIIISGGGGIGAKATAYMGNDLVRSIRTVIKYDRYQYVSTITEWQTGVIYVNGTRVRYDNRVWQASNPLGPNVINDEFDPYEWTIVPAGSLTGVDRTMGYYAPTVNQPGLDLPLLIEGVDYPGVRVFGLPFASPEPQPYSSTPYSIGNYNFLPGSYDYAGQPLPLNVIYQSSYSDIELGNRVISINVTGDNYISSNAGHAPEELVLCNEFDTLDLRVFTRPGGDPNGIGHGFPEKQIRMSYNTITPISFAGLIPYPVTIVVSNETTQRVLNNGIDYTSDWVNQTVTVTNAANGDVIVIDVYGLGGGNQLYKGVFTGQEVTNTITIPVEYSLIFELAWFVNGISVTDITYSAAGPDTTLVTLGTPLSITDAGTMVALSPTYISETSTVNYSWSAPQTQVISATTGTTTYTLSNTMAYTNPVNSVVNINGVRLIPAASVDYISNGEELNYLLPTRMGVDINTITPAQVLVYINNIPLVVNVDYRLNPVINGELTITLYNTPVLGSGILISVTTGAEYVINNNQITIYPVLTTGDLISVTSWNDTRQQKLLTQVFVGPVDVQNDVEQGFDDTRFSYGNFDFEPGSYDYGETILEVDNRIWLDRLIPDTTRLWVTVNGNRLFSDVDFTTRVIKDYQAYDTTLYSSGTFNFAPGSYDFSRYVTEIVLPYTLSPTDVVVVTECTNEIVRETSGFRIFQDMRGLQTAYSITEDSTTVLTEYLSAEDDIIFVQDASKLIQPNVVLNIWGVITIDGERIMYRERDVNNNTVSSLIRGTSGTGATEHFVGTNVYDMGSGNLLPLRYQNYVVRNKGMGDGERVTFVAEDITNVLDNYAIEVYVGGILQRSGYTITEDPIVTVVFDKAPAYGSEVYIQVRQAIWWNNPEPVAS